MVMPRENVHSWLDTKLNHILSVINKRRKGYVRCPSFLSDPAAPSAGPVAPATVSSLRGPARLSMLLAADRQDGVEAGEMSAALTTEPLPTEPLPTEPLPTEPLPTEALTTETLPTEALTTVA